MTGAPPTPRKILNDAKAILGRTKRSSTTTALKDLKWIPLHQRRKIHQGVFVHKAIHHKNSHHATSAILDLLPQHSHSTRHKEANKLNSWQHTSSLTERSTIFKSTHVWNSIPGMIRSAESTGNFKEQLQNYFITKYIQDESHVGETP